MFVSYLFLYLMERAFQKLISSSLEENVGIAFSSMTDRSREQGTTGIIVQEQNWDDAKHTTWGIMGGGLDKIQKQTKSGHV